MQPRFVCVLLAVKGRFGTAMLTQSPYWTCEGVGGSRHVVLVSLCYAADCSSARQSSPQASYCHSDTASGNSTSLGSITLQSFSQRDAQWILHGVDTWICLCQRAVLLKLWLAEKDREPVVRFPLPVWGNIVLDNAFLESHVSQEVSELV